MPTPRLRHSNERWVDLQTPPTGAHGVQFYEDDADICNSIAQYLGAGLAAGEPAIAIVTPAHAREIRARLGSLASDSEHVDLTFLDAREALDGMMIGSLPDAGRFEETIGRTVAEHAARGNGTVRAFGEMVDVLWREGNSRGAIRLEELWDELAKRHTFSLLCAYLMDDFLKNAGGSAFHRICSHHPHVFRPDGQPYVEGHDGEVERLRERADALEAEVAHRKRLEEALRDALGERERLIEQMQANVRFSEMFVGILGHDLRNPLMAIATAGALLERRNDSGRCTKPIVRIQSSARRMSRMIDQILDFTRLRIGTGFPLVTRRLDLTELVRGVVDELQPLDAGRSIELEAVGDTAGTWDEDRLCQVVSNLAGNALQHRASESPVRIRIDGTARDEVVVRFGNDGTITPALVAALFEPFHGGREMKSVQSSGLGLGLFISQQIVHAHAGRIEVESTEAAGTCFTVHLPRHCPAPSAVEQAECS